MNLNPNLHLTLKQHVEGEGQRRDAMDGAHQGVDACEVWKTRQ